jgi:spermine oxidase
MKFNISKLKKVIQRLYKVFNLQGSYSYRETDSDPLDIWHSDLATPLSFARAPRVLFAGEATTDNYYSAVHGAVDSARREVARLLQYVTA